MAVPWERQRAVRAAHLRSEAAPATVIWDRTHNPFDTWQTLLLDVGDRAAIVMEDDIVLTAGWRDKVELAIEEHRDALIQFFSLPRNADVMGSGWQPGRGYLMNQCHYLPPGMAANLLLHSSTWIQTHPDHPTAMDSCVADYLRVTGREYWLHVPSLVQHEKWTSEINHRRSSARQSRTFVP